MKSKLSRSLMPMAFMVSTVMDRLERCSRFGEGGGEEAQQKNGFCE